MARKSSNLPEPETVAAVVEPKQVTGTSRIFDGVSVRLPDPYVEPKIATKPVEKNKEATPHAPKDIEVGSAHIIKTIARTSEQNRMTRLVELARTDNDVKWLVEQFQDLNSILQTK